MEPNHKKYIGVYDIQYKSRYNQIEKAVQI